MAKYNGNKFRQHRAGMQTMGNVSSEQTPQGGAAGGLAGGEEGQNEHGPAHTIHITHPAHESGAAGGKSIEARNQTDPSNPASAGGAEQTHHVEAHHQDGFVSHSDHATSGEAHKRAADLAGVKGDGSDEEADGNYPAKRKSAEHDEYEPAGLDDDE